MNTSDSISTVQQIADDCIECKLCVKECKFLDTYSNPGQICKDYLADRLDKNIVYSCNLCGLCQAVCPKKLNIPHTFLEIRKELSIQTEPIKPEHKTICNYQRYGHSKLLSLYSIPDGCKSIFFPGCTLVGTRSSVTKSIFDHLQKNEPLTGIVLDCCHKPSHDLGQTDHFYSALNTILNKLSNHSVNELIVGCPSCYVTFKEYAPKLTVTSIYQKLFDNPPKLSSPLSETVSIHDACMTRFDSGLHDYVRGLVSHCGATVEEMNHSREKAICCGEGGAASFIAPEITEHWKTVRNQESDKKRMVTYCAGCSSTLGKEVNTTHLLDLLFDSEKAAKKSEQNTKTPFTYLRRLQLKQQLKKRQFL